MKVYVVKELVGDWDDPVVSSLLGCYYKLDQAERETKKFAIENYKVYPEIVGFSIALMSVLEEGTQEVYCSIYKHIDELVRDE